MRLTVEAARQPLAGALRPPGDKSISHRALILGGLAAGESEVHGLLRSADTKATRRAMEQLGVRVAEEGAVLRIAGLGRHGLVPPEAPLDMGNSGTAMRLLAGVLAAQPFDSVLTGDESLNRRPMARIVKPLELMGARIDTVAGGCAPLRIRGSDRLRGIDYASPVASAQVKSCVLLAGLYADGRTAVTEPRPSRDHTERMLPCFGVRMGPGAALEGPQSLRATRIDVPADPSSAAFLAAAALLVPGSDVLLRGVGLNPTRDAFFRALRAMGADVELRPADTGANGFEPVGDVRVRHGRKLRGIDVPPEWIPAMIDEVPILLALAASAEGVTRVREAAELRVKESDRIAVMAAGLSAMGAGVSEYDDGIDVRGGALSGADVDAANDHRCAMSFAVLGLAARGVVGIDGADYIGTSYPGFLEDLEAVGAPAARWATE